MSQSCIISVNGERVEILAGSILHSTTAYEYLRSKLRIMSLKYVSSRCRGGGNLGSIVMVTTLNPGTAAIDGHKALDALSVPIIGLHGCAITTLENLASTNPVTGAVQLHPVQARLVASGANPCGYCVPGVCMLIYTLLMNTMQPTVKDVDRALAGFWCRCSGFRAMLDAARSFAVDFDDVCRKVETEAHDTVPIDSPENYPPLSENAESRVIHCSFTRVAELRKKFPLYPHEHLKPPALAVAPLLFLFYGEKETAFLLPTSVDEVIRSCKVVPDYTTINGSDDFHNMVLALKTTPEGPPLSILSTSRVKEMLDVSMHTETVAAGSGGLSSSTAASQTSVVFIGAAATFAHILQRIPKLITPELGQKDPWTVAALLELRSAIEELSVTQVEENSITLVSHLLARPCGDLVPFLHCLKATLIVLTSRGREELSVVEVTGASRSIAKLDVVLGIQIPSQKNRFVGFCKSSLSSCPRAAATSAVALACDITRRDVDIVASNFTVAAAGASFYLTLLPEVASALERTNLSTDTIKNLRVAQDKLLMSLRNLVHGPSDGRVSYRITATRSLIFRLMCKLQSAVGLTPMDTSALYCFSAAGSNSQSTGFGVQSWETSYGGLRGGDGTSYTDTIEVDLPAVTLSADVTTPPPKDNPNSPPPLGSSKPGLPKAGAAGAKKSGGNGGLTAGDGFSGATKSPRSGVEAAPSKPASKILNAEAAAATAAAVAPTVTLPPSKRSVVLRSPVGDCEVSLSANAHALGQSQFVADVPLADGTLFAAFVRSTIPKGAIKAVNSDAAKAWPGVVAYYDFRDLPTPPIGGGLSSHYSSARGRLAGDDSAAPEQLTDAFLPWCPQVFAEKDVEFVGQVIGLVIAKTAVAAAQAASMVAVEYVKDHRVSYALSIAEARESKLFFPAPDCEVLSAAASPSGSAGRTSAMPLRKLFDNKDMQVFSGCFCVGSQFQVSSEPTTIVAHITGDDALEVSATTECATVAQQLIASKLLVPVSSVTVKTLKMGGPRPSPITASYAVAVALAAKKLRRAVLYQATLEEDMQAVGPTHSAMIDWRCAIDPVTTIIEGVDVQVYLNCGAQKAESEPVLRQVLRHVASAYHIPLVRARGVLCRTSYPPSIPHAGTGPAIGMLAIENIVDAVARNTKVPRWKLQQDHLLQPNEPIPCGQVPSGARLGTLWQDLVISSSISNRMTAAEDFNRTHRFVKRGIAMTPVLVGCRLPHDEDHRAQAVVALCPDGTVRVRHGVADCGNGVDTKVCQVVARCFRVAMRAVRVFGPDTSVLDVTTRSSLLMAADVACSATLHACETLLARLDPIAATLPDGVSLGHLVRAAIAAQVPMTAVGCASVYVAQRSARRSSNTTDSRTPRRDSGDENDVGCTVIVVPEDPIDHERTMPLINSSPTSRKSRANLLSSPQTAASPSSQATQQDLFAAANDKSSAAPPACFSRLPTTAEPYAYFAQGASCCEVELDVLTGQHRVVRLDVLVDAGQSLNPALDIAAVEAQVIKGMGWVTTEEVICGDKVHPDVAEGTYFNANVSQYLVPRVGDMPRDVRIALVGASSTGGAGHTSDAPQAATSSGASQAVSGTHGSKSVVEASLMLGTSALFALREAIHAAREHWTETRPPFIEMHAPQTAERSRMACTDEFSQGTFGGAECPIVGSY